MNKVEHTKQTVINVLNILYENQDKYIDPAEDVHDCINMITRYLEDDDLISYVNDFIFLLNSSANIDWEGILKKCVEILKTLNTQKLKS